MEDSLLLPLDHPMLETVSDDVSEFDGRIAELADTLLEVLDHEGGAALAAVQIGAPVRMVVADAVDHTGERQRVALVNPRITTRSEERATQHESCLSMPGYFIPVPRYALIEVAFETLEGETGTILAGGPLAVCLQQAIDLTNGILFIDRVAPLHRAQSDDISKTARRRAILH
ncbi:peptide deformylase [Pseudoprimorskyibacter insulae]|uniref:Peptide deformylase-like n=1 Tax=Pseudoprimorskyibacter insulae TaxID=1695997 RepID=A0A2R8AWN3_9RHOB|nr:peptide deformylase [Pseudoprimorskyibacter insulae]SPF80440.1 Peptide deformylase [Pseudoprimorskyibacter insulae]